MFPSTTNPQCRKDRNGGRCGGLGYVFAVRLRPGDFFLVLEA
jgi:hypothetical protein